MKQNKIFQSKAIYLIYPYYYNNYNKQLFNYYMDFLKNLTKEAEIKLDSLDKSKFLD